MNIYLHANNSIKKQVDEMSNSKVGSPNNSSIYNKNNSLY